MVNQLNGIKSPNRSLQELEQAGVSIVIYSTPCLFSAQHGMENYLKEMVRSGRLPEEGTVTMNDRA